MIHLLIDIFDLTGSGLAGIIGAGSKARLNLVTGVDITGQENV